MTPEQSASETISKILRILIDTLGDVTLSEAKTWVDVEENAKNLLLEGHEEKTDEQ